MEIAPRTVARLAGLLYLVVALSGGFAQLYARSSVLVTGDAMATASNLRDAETVVRLGLVADVVNVVAFVALALALYALLSPVARMLSTAFLVLATMSATIMGADLVNHAGALAVATNPAFAGTFGSAGADALAALFLDLHRYGYLVAEVFFGLWLLPLGLAVYRSGYFPRVLGLALVVGCFSYLASFALSISAASFDSDLAFVFALPAAIAELAFLAWLLIRGVRVEQPTHAVSRQGGTPTFTEGAHA